MFPEALSSHECVRDFLGKLEDPFWFAPLLEALGGVECFVKDAQGRRVYVTSGIWKRLGFSSAVEMVGKTDHDLFPPHIADQYLQSDQQVLSTGTALEGVLEIWVNEQGAFDWFVIHKYPVRGRAGHVVGIVGTLRLAERNRRGMRLESPTGRVAAYLRDHFREAPSLQALSRVAGLSERQLRRRFLEEFGVGPMAFAQRVRTHAAADLLLKTDRSIAEIAQEVGFCDQSAMTRVFREQMGQTPHAYRQRYGREP
jgi:AraC-like DNA-binding protein